MFSDVVSAGTKALGGDRFSLVSILPGTVLTTVVFIAAQSGAYGPGLASVGRLIGSDSPLRSAGIALLLIFILFLAGVLVQPFQVALVQYLEGYWDRQPTRTIGALAVEAHRRRLSSARAEWAIEPPRLAGRSLRAGADVARARARAARRQARARNLVRRYPYQTDRIMPTMLGNVLRNGEDAAGERYGLGALTVYPRMYPSISQPLSEAMARNLDTITLTASLCVSSALGAVLTSPLILRPDGWRLVPLAAGLLSILSYRGALRAAVDHGVLFATTFDLHRFDLIRALHHRLPSSVEEEVVLNRRLTRFLAGRTEPEPVLSTEHPYDHSILEQAGPAATMASLPPGDSAATLPQAGQQH